MARFLVKASEFKNVCKAVNDRKLAELKKEIIEILKKQDEKEVKKAIDYFNSQELHFTHLEKSLVSGKWIEKAGYGIGTVRIWKGKKYKKIAPGKWARVFDKEGRGTNIAIGKLIAKVQKIDNVEDLMAFVMANKQRFVDENGIDLPVLDKLRAAVDARNGNVGSKEKTVEDKIKENPDYPFKPKTDKERAERTAFEKDRDDFIERMDKIRQENKKKETDYSKMSDDELNELNKKLRQTIKEKDYGEADEEMEQINKISKQKIINSYKTKERHTLQHVEDVEQKKKMIADSKAIIEKDLARKEKQKIKESSIAKKNQLADEIDELKYKKAAFEQLEKEFEKEPDNENKTYWIQDNRGNRLTNEDAKKKIIGQMKYLAELEDMAGKKMNNRLVRDTEYYIDYLKDRLNPEDRKEIESEAEKHQNRSEAMKGNQNAKKYGLTDEQIERYDIQEVVEDVNGYGIVKNSEGKYSYIDDGRVKDRPDDFETSIEKVKERINDTYETKKNIQAAKNFDFKNAKLGSDIEYTKRNDGKHLYFKKSPDGSKAISVTVEVSDMREPLNMTYEVSDTKSGESWQYETAYGNKEGLEWAVEKPEQMEKELKKFFKRDPEKEWNKQNTTDSITNFESEGKVVSYDDLQPIATNKSVGENEVQMPYSKDLADEIESLKNCAAPEWENREFMKHVYYDDGNLVTTDGRRLKIVKVGKLDGIQDGTYVDITTDKSGINIKKREGMEDYRFPTYKKVMPDNLSQNVTLDSKLVKEKIKAMQKDGAIDKKGANIVQLEFRDGKVFIDDTAVGDAKDIQLKTSEGWNDPKEDTNYVHFNADYLTNALSGKTAVLQMGEDNHKAMAINTGSTSNVLMPMHGLNAKMDYSSNRSVKAAENEAKDKKKADNRKHSEQLIKDLNEEKIKESIENVAKDIDRQCETSDDDFLRSAYEKLNFNFDKILDKKRYITVHDKVNKDGLTFISAYMHSRLAKEHPEVKEKIAAELEKRGINVKKSLFDDFIVDVFADDDEEEIEDELYEGETEYNDYSAEQPELFNSTTMKVREALDRINNQVL